MNQPEPLRIVPDLAPAPTSPTIVPLSQIQPTPLQWLWPGRIPLGKLTLLLWQPAVGKSLLALDLAARVSNGRPWPDSPNPPCEAKFIGFSDRIIRRAFRQFHAIRARQDIDCVGNWYWALPDHKQKLEKLTSWKKSAYPETKGPLMGRKCQKTSILVQS